MFNPNIHEHNLDFDITTLAEDSVSDIEKEYRRQTARKSSGVSPQNEGDTATIQTSTIENTTVQECIRTLERADDSSKKAHSDFKEEILALKVKLHKELKELRDEVKTLRDEMKKGRDKKIRKRRAGTVKVIEEIVEGAQKSRRKRVKIQGHDCNLTIWLS